MVHIFVWTNAVKMFSACRIVWFWKASVDVRGSLSRRLHDVKGTTIFYRINMLFVTVWWENWFKAYHHRLGFEESRKCLWVPTALTKATRIERCTVGSWSAVTDSLSSTFFELGMIRVSLDLWALRWPQLSASSRGPGYKSRWKWNETDCNANWGKAALFYVLGFPSILYCAHLSTFSLLHYVNDAGIDTASFISCSCYHSLLLTFFVVYNYTCCTET